MSVILLLLKIIGIILLIVLGLLLTAVVLVLFCPFTYRVYGSFHDKRLNLHIRVFWLCYLLGFGMDQTAEEAQKTYLRILGIKKSLFTHANTKASEDSETESEAEPESEVETETAVKQADEEENKEPNKEQPEKRERKAFFGRIKESVSHIAEGIKKISSFMGDEKNQEAFHTIWAKVFGLLKKLMPRRLKLCLEYSTGSPDTTGQVLGILAMFPIGYRNRWNITPDFLADEAYVEADFDVKGHVFGVQILSALLGIVLDKNCQRLYNRIRR